MSQTVEGVIGLIPEGRGGYFVRAYEAFAKRGLHHLSPEEFVKQYDAEDLRVWKGIGRGTALAICVAFRQAGFPLEGDTFLEGFSKAMLQVPFAEEITKNQRKVGSTYGAGHVSAATFKGPSIPIPDAPFMTVGPDWIAPALPRIMTALDSDDSTHVPGSVACEHPDSAIKRIVLGDHETTRSLLWCSDCGAVKEDCE